jgi:hypothetical protein
MHKSTYKVKTVIKQKTLMGRYAPELAGGMHQSLPLLRKEKLVFLRLMIVDPQTFLARLFLLEGVDMPKAECTTYLKQLMTKMRQGVNLA